MAVAGPVLKPDEFIWGAVILGGIIAALAWRNLYNEIESDDDVLNVIPNKKLRKKLRNEEEDEDEEKDAMIVAVDATPKRVGGVLRLPKHKRLYYYSFYWTDHFNFPQKQEVQKFDMANTLVALVVFQSDITFFRHRYKKLLVKTDRNLIGQQKQQQSNGKVDCENATYDAQKLFDKVRDRLTFFKGELREADKDNDIDMYQASQLSKTGGLQYIPKGYNTYEITDWSVQARLTTEANMKQRINHKYYHAVDDYY